MKKFLVTGATGFVGSFLCPRLKANKFKVRAVIRNSAHVPLAEEHVIIDDLNGSLGWSDAMVGIDVVIHLAARVHIMKDNAQDPLTEFRQMNVVATERLARSAALSGVKRFVYVSSIKVNGEETIGGQSFSELNSPNPQDPYGVSKWEAEQALQRIAAETGLEVVIIRPPLVYGPGVKGNFAQLLRIVSMGIPLPLANINNLRDFIYVENLVDAVITCAVHPDAPGNTYLVSDGESISTPNLLRNMTQLHGLSSRLLPFPIWMLKLAAKCVGRSAQLERLIGSLQLDTTKIRQHLRWVPPHTLNEGLQNTVQNLK